MRLWKLLVVLGLSFCIVAGTAFSDDGYLHLNKVIDKLERGKMVTGIWCLSRDLANARYLVQYNNYPTYEESVTKPMIDFLLVAMEHYPYDISEFRAFTLGLTSRREIMAKGNIQPNMALFVRLPVEGAEPVHAMVKQALDVGAHGVVIPHVRNAEEAAKVVEACRYARPLDSAFREPAGTRGYSPAICSYLWGVTPEEYYERADVWPLNPKGDLMAIVMIEDVEGMKNAEEIVNTPGIGAVFFGPADFTVASGRYADTSFDVSVHSDRLKAICDSAGVPFIAFAGPDNIEQRARDNYKMLIIGADTDKSGSAHRTLEILRK